MIFTAEQAEILQREREMIICRPLFRRNGTPVHYEVGQIVAIQPGRFKPHTFHAVIGAMEPRTAGELRRDPDCEWTLPAEWGDDLELFDIQLLALDERCPRCPA